MSSRSIAISAVTTRASRRNLRRGVGSWKGCVLARGGAEDGEMVRPLHPHASPSGRRDGRATRTRHGTPPRPPRLRATHFSIAISAVTTRASRRNPRRGVGSWKDVCWRAEARRTQRWCARFTLRHPRQAVGTAGPRASGTGHLRVLRASARTISTASAHHARRRTASSPAIGPDAAVRSSRTGRRRRGSPAERRRPPRARSTGPAPDRARSRRYRGYARFPAG